MSRRRRPTGGAGPVQPVRRKGSPMVMHLDEGDVRAVLRWDRLITEMECVLTAFSSGRVIQPVRNMITIEEGRRYLGVMPAVSQASTRF